MNTIPAGYVETKKGVYERRDLIKKRTVGRKTILPAKGESSDGESEPPVRDGALAKTTGEKKNTGRVLVRITVFRKRLTDPDNNNCKWIIDCCRYAKLLHDDREQDVTLEIRQEKTRGEEETLIELFHESA